MNMIEAVKSVLSNYADFNGRARRSEFWWWQLSQILLAIVLLGIYSVSYAAGDLAGTIALAAFVIVWLGLIIPSIAVTVRRFHDTDKSGWFYLLGFIPYIGGIIVLVMMVFDGTPGENRFGPDPKGPDDAEVFA